IARTPLSQRSRVARRFAVLGVAAISVLAGATLRAPSSRVAERSSSGSAAGSVSGSIQAPETAMTAPPSTFPAPQSRQPVSDKTAARRTPAAYAFEARVVAGNQKSQEECKCRVVLANGKIIWRGGGDRRRIDGVTYEQVASMVYSHGRDPLWNGP